MSTSWPEIFSPPQTRSPILTVKLFTGLRAMTTSEPASNSSCAATTSSEPEKSASDGIMYGISRTWLIGSVV